MAEDPHESWHHLPGRPLPRRDGELDPSGQNVTGSYHVEATPRVEMRMYFTYLLVKSANLYFVVLADYLPVRLQLLTNTHVPMYIMHSCYSL